MKQIKMLSISGLLLATALLTAHAASAPTAEEISAAVSDHTYQGSMTADRFAEYYHANGDIKGDGYSGKWRAMDGKMCFQYGTDAESCWGAELNGPALTLMKGETVDGTGMLVPGNPYDSK